MFIVLAIGSLMDIKRPAYNIEAEKFHQLARAALFQSPIFEEPTIHAVQVLVRICPPHGNLACSRRPLSFVQYLMAFYLFLSERHGSGVGSRWAFMGLAVKLGVSVSVSSQQLENRIIICCRFLRWVCVSSPGKARYRELHCLTVVHVDRDAGRWKVDNKEIERRRQAFWELYVYDLWQVSVTALTFPTADP